MTIPPGSIEINDANAVVRGWMAAATGTFSGTFSATNVNAVDTINIRDGAVSAYYAFTAVGQSDVTITVPAQGSDYVPTLIVPMKLWADPQWPAFPEYVHGTPCNVRIRLYRDGVLKVDMNPIGRFGYITWPYRNGSFVLTQLFAYRTLKWVDPEADTTQQHTYRILVTVTTGSYPDGNNGSVNKPGIGQILDDILVEFRKR